MTIQHNMLRIKLQTSQENIDLDHINLDVRKEQKISAYEATYL